MTQLHIVEHKLYLNVFNFVSNFLLEILLYGKYELIDTKIDLSFKKSFRTIDDYINFATKQLILSLQQHFVEYQLNKEHTQIHEIYDMIDQLRGNPNMLYDIEHIFRKIFPFSIFIVEKDNFVEHYFELLECYVEYSTLIRLQEIKTTEPEEEIVEDEVELVEPTEEKEPKESTIVEDRQGPGLARPRAGAQGQGAALAGAERRGHRIRAGQRTAGRRRRIDRAAGRVQRPEQGAGRRRCLKGAGRRHCFMAPGGAAACKAPGGAVT